MQRFAYIGLCLSLAVVPTACKSLECGPNTIERNGVCAPADEVTGVAKCGPFTELQGDVCVPKFPPTVCDPATTSADVDPATGVTTCIGTGGGGCSAPFACPAPVAGKQTICGQIYNLADNSKFATAGATGAKCAAPTTSGPCALQLQAYDAIAYGNNPTGTAPLTTGAVYVDDCGRFRVPDITLPGGPFIAVGIDDAGMPFGPAGVTNTTGVAVPKQADAKTKDLEAWVVDKATTDQWTSTGGPPLSGGIYVGIFRQHGCDAAGTCTGDAFANQAGVTITKSGATVPANDYYFQSETTHLHVDGAATATSINGTVLLTNASVNDSLVYSGTGGITDTVNCQWETHAAASLANIVFLQVYRPTAKPLKTCTL
jgi:hypothetical protein